MKEISYQIYSLLRSETGYVPVKDLACKLGTDARSLRGKDGEPGILETAAQEIYDFCGKVLVTRMNEPSGVKLTGDPEEIEAALAQWSKWYNPIRQRLQFYQKCYNEMTSDQLRMEL